MSIRQSDGDFGKSPNAFRTISEVAGELDVPQHVLRFWETKFSQVRPMKRAGGRRYYRPQDIDLLRGIRTLLYAEGLTIKGVQKILREKGNRAVIEAGQGAGAPIALGGKQTELAAPVADPGLQADEPAFDFIGGAETDADEDAAAGGRPAEPGGTVIPLSVGARRRPTADTSPLQAGEATLTEDARAALRKKLGDLLDARAALDAARERARAVFSGTPAQEPENARRAGAKSDRS